MWVKFPPFKFNPRKYNVAINALIKLSFRSFPYFSWLLLSFRFHVASSSLSSISRDSVKRLAFFRFSFCGRYLFVPDCRHGWIWRWLWKEIVNSNVRRLEIIMWKIRLIRGQEDASKEEKFGSLLGKIKGGRLEMFVSLGEILIKI